MRFFFFLFYFKNKEEGHQSILPVFILMPRLNSAQASQARLSEVAVRGTLDSQSLKHTKGQLYCFVKTGDSISFTL